MTAGTEAGQSPLGVCPLCGRPLLLDAVFELEGISVCAECKPRLVQMIREGVSIDGLDATFDDAIDLQHFVGSKKWPVYRAKFRTLSRRRWGWSWNWPAFLLGLPWILYRRMYLFAVIFCAIELVKMWIESLVESALGNSVQVQAWIAMTDLVLWVGVAGWGNWIYLVHTRRKIAAIDRLGLPAEDRLALIAKSGGTRVWPAILFTVIFILLILFFTGGFEEIAASFEEAAP